MNEGMPVHQHLPTREVHCPLRAELDDLARDAAELERGFEAALTGEPQDASGFAHLVARRSSITEQRLARLAGWMASLDERLARVESCLARVSREVSGHEEALKLLCEVLKELDDPYGLGVSLDERIARESAEGIPSEPED